MIALASCGGGEETVSTTSTEAVDVAPELDPPEATTNAPSTGSPDEPDSSQDPEADEGEAPATAGGLPSDPEGVIEAVFTGSLPPETICDELLTSSYVEKAYGSREGCLAGQEPGALAETVEVTKLEYSKGKATVVPTGGPYDGVEVQVQLVVDDGIRVDSLSADVPAGP